MTFDSSEPAQQRGTRFRVRGAMVRGTRVPGAVAALAMAAALTVSSGVVHAAAVEAKPVTPAPAADSTPTQKHWGFIEKHCFECHNTTDWAGGLAFDSMTM